MPQQTIIMDKTAEASGIRVAAVGAGVIADEHEVQGLLTPVEGRMAQVTARYPGPVRSLRVSIGDTVKAGQMLASIESNLSLTTYNITSPISGTVMARNAAVGLTASEGTPLFEVVDLSSLWVDLHIFGADAGHIGAGAPVTVTRLSDGVSVETVLDRVLPGTATASQSTIARATLPNTDGLWRPGSAVKARITVDRQPADLVVPVTALQTAEDESGESSDVVYVQQGDIYHTRLVKLGRRDAQKAEVLDGLKVGERVVVQQSFLVKADIENRPSKTKTEAAAMLEYLIIFSIRHRWLMLALTVALVALGIWSYKRLAIDVTPDITNVQVQINTQAVGYSPLEAEQRITFRSKRRWQDCRRSTTPARSPAMACRRSLWCSRTAPTCISPASKWPNAYNRSVRSCQPGCPRKWGRSLPA